MLPNIKALAIERAKINLFSQSSIKFYVFIFLCAAVWPFDQD